MDPTRFDELTKAWATGTSRRTLLRGLLGGVAGGVTGAVRHEQAGAVICREGGVLCANDAQCCSGSCVNYHCTPVTTTTTTTVPPTTTSTTTAAATTTTTTTTAAPTTTTTAPPTTTTTTTTATPTTTTTPGPTTTTTTTPAPRCGGSCSSDQGCGPGCACCGTICVDAPGGVSTCGGCLPAGKTCNYGLGGGDCCSGTCCIADSAGITAACCGSDEVCTSFELNGLFPGGGCCKRDAVCQKDPETRFCCVEGYFCDPPLGCCDVRSQGLGDPCTADADCCLHTACVNGTCCIPNLFLTPSAALCCSGHMGTTGPAREPLCVPCVAPGGQCTGPADCCSGTCSDGLCTGCVSDGSFCEYNQDCCSGHCAYPGTVCSPCSFEECAADADCCSGTCGSDGFCTGCVSDGSFCVVDGNCCSGKCVNNACTAGCQLAGSRCRTTADCCTGSTCLRGHCTTLLPPPG